jgi:3-isopropylmalate dehydratase small subunit
VLVCSQVDQIQAGDLVSVDAATGAVHNKTRGVTLTASPRPQFLVDMIADGGLVPHREKRVAAERAATERA